MKRDKLIFKIADEPDEFEQIHAFNYQTFVKEIPQHQRNKEERLVDKFHDENIYVICMCDNQLLGMIALRDKRPFSLDQKIEDISSYLPPFSSILEYRLLAIKSTHRNTKIFTGIMQKAFMFAMDGGYDLAIISGLTAQEKLYKHLGFKSFAYLVGSEGVQYQPMYIDVTSANKLQRSSLVL